MGPRKSGAVSGGFAADGRLGLVYKKPAAKPVPSLVHERDGLFRSEDGSLSFGYVCKGLDGFAPEKIERRLVSLFTGTWPDHSLLQICLASTRVLRKVGDEQTLEGFRFDVFVIGIIGAARTPGNFPLFGSRHREPEKDAMIEAGTLSVRLQHALCQVGLAPQPIDEEGFAWHVRPVTSPSGCVFDSPPGICVDRQGLWLGDDRVSVLSASELPDDLSFGSAARYIGDSAAGGLGLTGRFMVTLNVYFPGAGSKPFLSHAVRWRFGIGRRDAQALPDGHRIVRAALGVVLFSGSIRSDVDPEQRRESATARSVADVGRAAQFWRELGFVMRQENAGALSGLLNALPFCADLSAAGDVRRYRPMTTRQALCLAPLFSDWQGSGTPALSFLGRNGSLLELCLFDGSGYFSATIAGPEGSGKTVLAGEIIRSYLSQGAAVWVIDGGESYAALCEAWKGRYVDVPVTRGCLSPFLVTNYDEAGGDLQELVTAMASYIRPLEPEERRHISEAIRCVLGCKRALATIDDIADAMLSSEDGAARDAGACLLPWTSDGEFGHFAGGFPCSNFPVSLKVLNIEKLRARPDALGILLLVALYRIQQEMFREDPLRKKLLVIDDAWDGLEDQEGGWFFESLHRRFRSWNAAVITTTQSMSSFSGSATGRAMAQASGTTFLLGPIVSADSAAVAEGFGLSDPAREALVGLRTVPGRYSEVYVKAGGREGVGRLFVSAFNQMLYSRKLEDRAAIARFRGEGLSLEDAIHMAIDERSQRQNAAPASPAGADTRHTADGNALWEEVVEP